MFGENYYLTELDLSSLNTANAETMEKMFMGCARLEKVNVTNFEGMFKACWVIQSLDLSNFDLSKATTCKDMFLCCELLTDVGCELNIPSGIDTTDMYDRSGME